MFRILLRPGWTLVQGPLVCRFRLAGNDRHRSPRDRRSWNCFRAYILDWHDHSRDSCEAPRIDHAPKDQLNRFPSLRCASAIQIVRPLESTPETQPQLQPALLRLSAMIFPVLHFRSGEIRILDSSGNDEQTIPFSEADRRL